MRAGREEERQFADGRKTCAAKQLDGRAAFEGREVKFNRLGEPREVGHHQQNLLLVPQDIGQNLAVLRREKFHPPLA